MALAILDGTQTATTLSTILSSGQHITAHTVVSLGTQAKTDILSAVSSGIAISGTVNAVFNSGYVDGMDLLQQVNVCDTVNNLPPISGTVTANIPLVNIQPNNVTTGIGVILLTDEGRSVFDNSSSIKATLTTALPAGTNSIGGVTATDLGAKADAVATTDTGTFSVIAFIKRGLQNWTSLLAKIPTLVSGRIPVDGSGVTQPVSLASLPALVAGTAQIGSVSIAPSTTPAVTTFTSITSATLIASNTSRKMLTIQNAGAGILYVLLGSGTASSTNFSVQLNSYDFYENDYYSGQINAIFATAGTAYVTSLT